MDAIRSMPAHKYGPAFPDRFGSLEDGRAFGQYFFDWYNHGHHHSGLGFLPRPLCMTGWPTACGSDGTPSLPPSMRRIPNASSRGGRNLQNCLKPSGSTRSRRKKRLRMPEARRSSPRTTCGSTRFPRARPVGIADHRARRNSNYAASGVSMSLTGSASMNRAPTDGSCNSHSCIPGISVGAYAPAGAPALTSNTATDRPTTTTESRQVVGDTPLLTLRRQK